MKLFMIFTFLWTILKVSTVEGAIHWQDIPSIVFEGTMLQATCADNGLVQQVSLLKDGALISVFNTSNSAISSGGITANYFGFNIGFILLVDWNNLTREASGVYTCQANKSLSADLPLKVSERKATCETAVRDRTEYNVGEELKLTCYNPFEDLGLTAGWYLENGTKLQEAEIGSNPLSSTAIISLDEKDNSTSYYCFLVTNDTLSVIPSHSCSVGPIFVYNSSFIRIESFDGSSIRSTRSVTINCRIIPQGGEVLYDWVVNPSVATMEISESEMESNLTLTNFALGTQDILEISITCEGMLSDMNFTSEYTLTVYKVHNESTERANLSLIVIIVLSAVLGPIAITIVFTVCYYIIIKRCRKTTLGISEGEKSKNDEVITPHGIVLNKYDKGPDYEDKHKYEEEDKRNSILSRLPDGRFHLETRRPSATSNLSNGSSFSNASERSMKNSVGEIYDDPPMKTLIPLEVITPNGRPSSTPDEFLRPSFGPPPPPLQYTTTLGSPSTPPGIDFTSELKNRLSSPAELATAPDDMIYDEPPSDHLYYSDDDSPVYASVKKEKSFYDEVNEEEYAECKSRDNDGYESEDDYAGIMEHT